MSLLSARRFHQRRKGGFTAPLLWSLKRLPFLLPALACRLAYQLSSARLAGEAPFLVSAFLLAAYVFFTSCAFRSAALAVHDERPGPAAWFRGGLETFAAWLAFEGFLLIAEALAGGTAFFLPAGPGDFPYLRGAIISLFAAFSLFAAAPLFFDEPRLLPALARGSRLVRRRPAAAFGLFALQLCVMSAAWRFPGPASALTHAAALFVEYVFLVYLFFRMRARASGHTEQSALLEEDTVPVDADSFEDDSVVLAGFWRRAAAFGIDFVLVSLLISAARRLPAPGLGAEGAQVLIPFLYFGFGWSYVTEGQTAGKMFVKIQVLRSDGRPCGLFRALFRWAVLVPVFNAPAFYRGLVGAGAPAFSLYIAVFSFVLCGATVLIKTHPFQRGLHDLLAGTLVVRKGRYAARWLQTRRREGAPRRPYLVWILSGALVALGLSYLQLWRESHLSGKDGFREAAAAVEKETPLTGVSVKHEVEPGNHGNGEAYLEVSGMLPAPDFEQTAVRRTQMAAAAEAVQKHYSGRGDYSYIMVTVRSAGISAGRRRADAALFPFGKKIDAVKQLDPKTTKFLAEHRDRAIELSIAVERTQRELEKMTPKDERFRHQSLRIAELKKSLQELGFYEIDRDVRDTLREEAAAQA